MCRRKTNPIQPTLQACQKNQGRYLNQTNFNVIAGYRVSLWQYGFTLIPAWVSNCMHCGVREELYYPLPKIKLMHLYEYLSTTKLKLLTVDSRGDSMRFTFLRRIILNNRIWNLSYWYTWQLSHFGRWHVCFGTLKMDGVVHAIVVTNVFCVTKWVGVGVIPCQIL